MKGGVGTWNDVWMRVERCRKPIDELTCMRVIF